MRPFKFALVVETLLGFINLFDRIITLSLSVMKIFNNLITYTVPYRVLS